MKMKVYDELPNGAVSIRKKVFMEEQGFKDEFDEIDKYAAHILLTEADMPVATGRFFYSESKKCYVIGRIAVLREYRGNNYGAEILKEAETEIYKRGGSTIGLSAQVRVLEFYKKCGYQEQGETYLDEGCPHIWMCKDLNHSENK